MKLPVTCFILASLFLASAQGFNAQNLAEKVIADYIAKDAGRQRAVEYEEARKIIYGDVNGDRIADAVVQYTLEGFDGGNNFAQTLAIFINEKGRYKFAARTNVGSKLGDKTSTLKSIFRRKIRLETTSCAEPPQGICENPKKGNTTITFRNGKILVFGGRLS